MDTTTDVLSMLPLELADRMEEAGHARFRAQQLFRALWQQNLQSYDALTVWPEALRSWAHTHWPFTRVASVSRETAKDGTDKVLLKLADGETVEAVSLPHPYGWSVCVSTQVGCAMGCHFCASGLNGKKRHLTAGEIADQVAYTGTLLKTQNAVVSRVDLMGIGEPLDNYDGTVRFLKLAHEPLGLGLSYRHLTVSTSGLVPKILQLSEEGLPITLAISLHAPNDRLREQLMPINRAYPLAKLIPACETYWERTRRRITYEYLLIRDVNDTPALALELVDVIGHFPCHVNLIPWNPVPEHPFQPSPASHVRAFQEIVEAHGISCTVRRELGQEIEAACGQLRRRETAGPGLTVL